MKFAKYALTILLAGAAFGDSQLNGTVTDESGGPVPGAMILIHWDPFLSTLGKENSTGIKKDLVLTTDKKGKFTAEVPPGYYDLFVASPGFLPASRKIRLNGVAISEPIFQLKVMENDGALHISGEVPIKK